MAARRLVMAAAAKIGHVAGGAGGPVERGVFPCTSSLHRAVCDTGIIASWQLRHCCCPTAEGETFKWHTKQGAPGLEASSE